MSPGIETTWTMRNPLIYSAPYRIRIHKDEAYYREHGLGTLGDETGPMTLHEALSRIAALTGAAATGSGARRR